MGLTVLETIANPYPTVLSAKQFAATHINLVQSCNGVGWIFGPIVGGIFFYSNDGAEIASQTLYIPHVVVAVIVLVIAAVFMVAPRPELNTQDAYSKEDASTCHRRSIWTRFHFPGAVLAQFVYVTAQAGIFSFFINYIVSDTPSLPSFLKDSSSIGGDNGLVQRASMT